MLSRYLLIVFALTLAACNRQEQTHTHPAEHPAEKYTCSMHPQVIQDKPGTCPICGMTLVKITSGGGSGNRVMLNEDQMKLANIRTAVARRGSVGETVIVNGTLMRDEEKSEVIGSRAEGRIERLYMKETGRPVRKGQPLYTLYSETLLTLQQEYLLAREQYDALGDTEKRYSSFMQAAEKKLLLYGLTRKQIEALTPEKALEPRITFVSPTSGIVTEIGVSEGAYVAEGTTLYRIENIDSLWVAAELYPGESALVKTGDYVTVRVNGFESSPVKARVRFLSPEYRDNSQVMTMRATIGNRDHRFAPGQQAQVSLTPSSRPAITLPADAVIRDGKGAHVYVMSGRNVFEPRMIKTGVETSDSVEITEGLLEGDTVAVRGAYLLYSEIILKKNSNPMAGHVH
ncbi:MAG TPA: efflux RND transporter periplasmic adaptor subunit [Chryseosolibacter sp.]